MIKIKNIHEQRNDTDGFRILVDRLWPRGVTKQKAQIDLWLKNIAPTNDLRKWYSHDEEKWEEFKTRYFEELKNKNEELRIIPYRAEHQNITLVYASKSPFNNAKVLLEYIEEEFQMIEKNKVLEILFKEAGDGILFCDTNGTIRLWNIGCEKIFGYNAKEAIGESLNIIIPEKYRKPHWNGFFNAVKSKTSKYADDLLSVPAMTKENKSISIDFTIAVIQENSELFGFVAIIRDVTKNWQEQKELKKKIRELEKIIEAQKQ